MRTRLSAFAAGIIESGWLAALIIVPILFNVYTERVFEEDKIPLMRSIALVMLLALVVWGLERGKKMFEAQDGRPWWKIPLVVPALVLAGAYVISTVFSIVPRISWWGAYIRRQGTYTWLSYITIFFGVLFLARDRKQVQRIITIILLTSVPATLYAFLQNRGLDPLPWGGDVTRRVSSTAGNPIFISAYLIMVVPLTIMRIIEHFKILLSSEEAGKGEEGKSRQKGEDGKTPNYLASSLLSGAYLFLLIIQLMTIVYSQSRGPLLGLLVGMTFFTILASVPISRWLTFFFTALAVGGIVFLVVFNLPNTPLEPLREVQYLGRMGTVFQLNSGNGKVRALIWNGVVDLLAADPIRDMVGYGPESLYVAYNKHYPPELTTVEKRNASPDRSHNETFDALSMTGLLGFGAQTFFFLAIFYYVLKWLGVINTDRQRYTFIGLLIIGGGGGVILPYLIEGQWRLAGAGFPAGLALAVIAYLFFFIVSNLGEVNTQNHPEALLLTALLASIMAHFIEAHFGIAIGVTRLYFWVYAALVVVVGLPLMQRAGGSEGQGEISPESGTSSRRNQRRKRKQAQIASGQFAFMGTIVLSLLMSLLLIVMTFNFYTLNIDLSVNGYSLVWLFMATWFFGALVVAAESSFQEQDSSGWLPRVGIYVAISLLLWGFFSLVYIPGIQPGRIGGGSVTVDQLKDVASPIVNSITYVYVFTFLMMGLITAGLMSNRARTRVTMRAPIWMGGVYGVVVLPIIMWLIVTTNLNVSRADVYNKQGTGYERQRQWDAAIVFYQIALDMQPHEDRYLLNMGRSYMEKARTITDNPAERDQYLDEALTILERAQQTNPMNTDHTRNLASLHRAWAQLTPDAAQKEQHLESADKYYGQAIELSPNNAAIWNDWASLSIERNQVEDGLDKLDHSISIDPWWINTYGIRANVAVRLQDFELALGDYEEMIERQPTNLTGLSGRAYALAQLGLNEEAIEANEELLAAHPTDYNSHKNLAILYQQTQNPEKAREAAQNAIAVGNEQQQAEMQQFLLQIEQLIQQSSGTSGE